MTKNADRGQDAKAAYFPFPSDAQSHLMELEGLYFERLYHLYLVLL